MIDKTKAPPLLPATVQDRIRFVRFDEQSTSILNEYRPYLNASIQRALTAFYAEMSGWPNLVGMFKEPSRMNYAQSAQYTHWTKLFEATFNEDYVTSVKKIGLIHSKIGLEPSWYIMAYSTILNGLYTDAIKHYKSFLNPAQAQEKTARLIRALNMCAMIDMDISITVYLEENKIAYDKMINDVALNFEETIGSIVKGVSETASELESSAASLQTMAGATAQSVLEVTTASSTASTNVSGVSKAAEDMLASISQVAELANKSFNSSRSALDEASQSVSLMAELKKTIDTVSGIIELITGIAKQTDLLALNATIESARAGEAGKGFAVVASEVKSLANETSKATDEIKLKVQEMLGDSEKAVRSIETMLGSIRAVSEVSKETAESAEQQKQAVVEIARSVDQVESGTREISRNIDNISETASKTDAAASQLLKAVKELSTQEEKLENAVSIFIESVRS